MNFQLYGCVKSTDYAPCILVLTFPDFDEYTSYIQTIHTISCTEHRSIQSRETTI